MKKLVLAAAIASMLSGAAFAAANLDAGTSTNNTYASEVIITNPTTLASSGAGVVVEHTATATFGASFATDFVAYVRFDLPAGVTFTAAPSYAVADSDVVGGGAVVSIAQGGAGQEYVIFAVAPSTVGQNLVGASVGTFTAAGITIPAKAAVTLRYRLFETLTNAANKTLSLKDTLEQPFLSFAPALAITPGATVTRTADVASAGGAYRKFVGDVSTVTLNSFTVTHTPLALPSGVLSTPSAILTDTSSVTITGNFAARGTVTLVQGGNVIAAAPISDTTAVFPAISAATITGAPWLVTYAVNTTTQIPAAEYTGTIDLVGKSVAGGSPWGFSPADGNTGLASVIRNGTVLKAAFAEASTVSGTASAVSLTNTSSSPAPFTVRCLNSGAATIGTPGSVPANSSGRFAIVSALGCPAGVRGLELTFAVPVGSVIGSVVRQNLTTGVAGFDGMVGNQ